MTKKEIVKQIAEATGVPLMTVSQIVQMLFDGITEILVEEGSVELRNFGVFKVRQRKPRKARNPRTGATVSVPTMRKVTFRAGKEVLIRLAERNGRSESHEGAIES